MGGISNTLRGKQTTRVFISDNKNNKIVKIGGGYGGGQTNDQRSATKIAPFVWMFPTNRIILVFFLLFRLTFLTLITFALRKWIETIELFWLPHSDDRFRSLS